jgi:hypothetical protein
MIDFNVDAITAIVLLKEGYGVDINKPVTESLFSKEELGEIDQLLNTVNKE